MQTQYRVKNAPDFVGRNRRAARNWGREEKAAKHRQTKNDKKPQRKETNDTMEISKSDLERLLKMAVSLQPFSDSPVPHTRPTHAEHQPQPPGLQSRAEKEEKREKRSGSEQYEEYCPWGRPGGGAPIRTASGTLLTNYSTRGQEVESLRKGVSQQPSLHSSPPQKPQFARGLGPHVDTFVLSQREEQRMREQMHKAELAAQIEERQRQKEAERRRREEEEMEAERKARRELEEINRRNERERERRQQKTQEVKMWQSELQARVHEAEEAAAREKQRVIQRSKPPSDTGAVQRRTRASRIPLPSHCKQPQRALPHTTGQSSLPLSTVTMEREVYPPPQRPLSPVVPALAKKLGLPAANHQQPLSPQPVPSSLPPSSSHTQPITTSSLTQPKISTLPSLPPPKQHTGTPFPTHTSHTARQQKILNQLAILREGILSHKKSLDSRLQCSRQLQ